MRFPGRWIATTALAVTTALAGGMASASVVFFDLDGGQEVTPVTTSATGKGWVMVNKATKELSFKLKVRGLTTADLFDVGGLGAVHLHNAPAGANGPVVVPFTFADARYKDNTHGFKLNLRKASFEDIDLTGIGLKAFLSELKDGNIYVNVHTLANTSGEIRGQINAATNAAVPAVPVPASGLLLIAGLGAFAAARRRKAA